jgi:hypothetical protein
MTKRERFREAYLEMASRARYRPEAPNDGLGTICMTPQRHVGEPRLRRRRQTPPSD